MRISDWSSDVCSSDLSKDHGIRYDLVGVELHFLDKGIDFGASSNLIVVPWVGRGVSVGRRADVERILDRACFGIGLARVADKVGHGQHLGGGVLVDLQVPVVGELVFARSSGGDRGGPYLLVCV